MTEHLITITLSPTLCNQHRIKGQLKHTYKYMVEAFNTGMGCLEFTKNGNCHYHIKTQDDISDIHVFLDTLKGVKNSKKEFVFGFTQCDQTKNQIMIGNYDYIEKSHLSVEQTLKKLKLSETYKALWVFKPKKTRFNDTSRSCGAYKNPFLTLTPEEYEASSSDTLDNLIIHNIH